jgi:S1-C subfamily serine protease
VISNAEINTFQHPRRPGNNYQTVAIEMEVRLYDSKTKDVVYEQSFPGSAYDEGSRPTALAPAVLEAVEGALADPDFVSHVTRSRGEPPSLDSVRVAACDVGTVALPEDLQAVSAAVVTVRLGAATGSGVLISGDGHVLTAAHLVDSGAQPRVVLASGLELDAQVERIDRIADLALLVLPGRHHRCARLLDGERQAVGSEVFAVGSPIAERLSGTVTRGVVSGYPTIDGQELIQTDAAVSPGNSGGPIVDRRGRVLGIVTSKALGVGVEGIAFGVPAAVVRERLALDLEEPAPAP